jgi:peptidoglycan/LPS O-acetylase OafA/YrhL
MKIVPSYLLSIAVVFAIGYAQFDSTHELVRSLVTHLLFIHTWWSDTYGNLNGVLWTLAVEVQFYALFPLLWLGFRRSPWITAALMIALSLIYREFALACCTRSYQVQHLIDNLPGYLDIFAFGMVTSLVYVRYRDRLATGHLRWPATAIALAGFALLAMQLQNVWSIRTVDQWSTIWQIVNRTWLGVSFTLIAAGSLFAARPWKAALANPVLLFFGAISYNLYLYHQVLARELFKLHVPPYTGNPHLDPRWQVNYTILAFVLTTLQAAIFTYFFERPLLRIPPETFERFVARLWPSRALPRG